MTIDKLVALERGNPTNSNGADVAESVNKLIDAEEANQLTTTELINGIATYPADVVITTSGFLTSGDGGSGSWKQNGVTGQTPNQTPAQLVDALLNDGNGNQWALVGLSVNSSVEINPLSLGATNATALLATQAAVNRLELNSFGGVVRFPAGVFINDGSIVRSVDSPVLIRGAGPLSTTIINTVDSPVIDIQGTQGNIINGGGVSDLTIRGAWDQVSENQTEAHGIKCTWTNRNYFHNIRMFSCRNGMDILHASDDDWYNIHVQGGGTDQNYIGFMFNELDGTLAGRQTVQALNCISVKCKKYGWRIFNANGSKITNCESIGAPGNDETEIGFYIGDTVGVNAVNTEFIHFVNCLSDQNKLGAWLISKGPNALCKRIYTSNCWAGGSDLLGGYGFKIIDASFIKISDAAIVAHGGHAVWAIDCNDLTISDNSIEAFNAINPASSGYDGIFLENSDRCVISGNDIITGAITSNGRGIVEDGTSNTNTITGNSATTGGLISGANSLWSDNLGIVTRNAGSATIASGTNNVVVVHGCDFTPTFGDIMVTPRDNPEFFYFVGVITATTFTLSTSNNVTTGRRFGWKAERIV